MKQIISNMSFILILFFSLISCNSTEQELPNIDMTETANLVDLPIRAGTRPETTPSIPHHQIDVDLVPEVNEEMIRRIYSIPGIEDQPSVVLSWQGLWLEDKLNIVNEDSFIGGREFGHIHDDGSLHIFLEPQRAIEAIEAGWAVAHPFAAEGRSGWEGFVMLYTPQSIEELNITFQLIVEAYNYITGQALVHTDFYG